MVFEHGKQNLKGSEHPGFVRKIYTKSKFDRISSSGLWEDKWKDMPKICRLSTDKGITESEDKVVIFYWNDNSEKMTCKVSSNFDYSKEVSLNKSGWTYDIISAQDYMEFNCNVQKDDLNFDFTKVVTKENIKKLNTRFLLK